jgi:hypothetical protein
VAKARPAWEATAAEQGAVLVPTGPSLHKVSLRARVLSGEERAINASLLTTWTKEGPSIVAHVDLEAAPLPPSAWEELEAEEPKERLRPIRSSFPVAHVVADGQGATLSGAAWADDPRPLLSVVETFFEWVLEVRGERRTELPYR